MIFNHYANTLLNMPNMIKQTTLIAGLILLVKISFAQSYFSDFNKAINTNDTLKQREILEKWEKEDPKNPELFTSYFNYYFHKSRNEILVVAAGDPQKGEEYLSLAASAGNYAGFIGSQINYDDSFLKKGLDKIDEAIKLYPNRLDMRFGKIYMLGQIKDWQSFTGEIIKTVNYSVKNSNNWTWTFNESRDGGESFFLSCLQDYQMQLYNTGNDVLLKNMQDIAKTVLKHYPNHIESLSNLSIGYLITQKYDKALVPLLKAEELNPKDFIVLTNIAYAYKEKGEKNKAIEYYKKVEQFGDDSAKDMAKKEMAKLREE
jgi:tetratricopeptide (TPR) repeat protein